MRTDDGFFEFIEGKAFIGKKYKYSPKTRGVHTVRNEPSGTDFECELVWAYDDSDDGFHMMPTECLSFP
jgi:hypothetical protein